MCRSKWCRNVAATIGAAVIVVVAWPLLMYWQRGRSYEDE